MMNEPWQRLPALSLKQLQYFVTLAQLRHFTDTASRLAISQPALSSALRQIETVLGGKLVNRTAATVTLTELGAAILPHAQRILSVAQAAFSDMQQIVEAGGDGTVRIGLVPSVSSLLFPLLPQTLAEAFPRLRIEFHDQTNDALIQALQRGEIDVLGSDCHNMTTRPPRLGEAIQVIQKSVERDVWREFQRNLPDLSGKGERL